MLDRLNPRVRVRVRVRVRFRANPDPNPNPNPNRLNPLLERGGELELPESGLLPGGRVRTIRRHPSFRLLLTVDPSRGELSRAMRNRGVEVAVEQP